MSQTFSLQKSKKLLEEQGYAVGISEKPYNPYSKRREDLFGFADLIAIREDVLGSTAIQACGEDVASHTKKLLEGGVSANGKVFGPNPYLSIWLQARNRFFIWSWVMRGARGKRKTYECRQHQAILSPSGQVSFEEIT